MATFSNQAKNTASFSNQSKNTSLWANQSKNSASFSNQSKNTSIFDMQGSDLLLQENGYFLLLESSVSLLDRIILEQGGSRNTNWINLTKH